MALASQNARSDRNNPNARGRGPTVFVLIAVGAFAAFMGIRALIGGGEDGSSTPRSASASATITTEPENQTRRTALDEAIANAGTDDAPASEQKSAPTVTTPAEPAPTPTPAPTPSPAPIATPEPTPAPVQPPVATPEQPKNDGAAAQEAPREPKDSTSPNEEQPAAKPAPSQPFFGNGLNASKPLVTPADASATEPAADSPAGKLKAGLAIAGTEPVKARALLSAAMLSGTLSGQDSYDAFNALAQISSQLFLTPVFNAGDTTCMQYTVEANDSLEKIVRRNKIGCDWRLIARLNNIKKPESIQVGKRLKLPKGPFSAVVWKRDYRIDICVGEGADRVIVASMPVGLGEANGTPTGMFKVRSGSKLLNPEWTHPVTGQRYAADDPANPIGEHWLGLEGTEEKTSSLKGYGIHGTVELDSIGQNRSLGCVRLLAGDVALVWECLGDGATVEIRP